MGAGERHHRRTPPRRRQRGPALALRTEVEELTDELASDPWSALTPQEADRLAELLLPPVLDIVAAGIPPTQGTLGIGMKYDYEAWSARREESP
ncbi:hypothetical protein [Streptomyces sp. NPDC059552]|uniref:helix-turn-helix domain-containing protein n=1 Tax=unclassified Streptomyces TaxID=2593676 RepID=UPI0036A2D83A